jgi:hypothetical protein
MPAGARLTYDNLQLFSSEVIKFDTGREFQIVTQGTVAMLEITQPGNLTPIYLNIEAIVRGDASAKLTAWMNKVTEKPLAPLNFLNRNWGNSYLTKVEIDSEEMDEEGGVLAINMKLSFLINQNFG